MPCSSGASAATLTGHPATTPKTAHTHTLSEEVVDMGHVQCVLLHEWIVKTHLVNSSQRAQEKKNQSLCPHLNPVRETEKEMERAGGGAGTALRVIISMYTSVLQNLMYAKTFVVLLHRDAGQYIHEGAVSLHPLWRTVLWWRVSRTGTNRSSKWWMCNELQEHVFTPVGL